MSQHELFIRSIVDNPTDDSQRLDYANWLDAHDDHRGEYLREELKLVKFREQRKNSSASSTEELRRFENRHRRLIKKMNLDGLWVARVTRPPIGSCFRFPIFDITGPSITIEEINSQINNIPFLPTEYVAFLLNYNGGVLKVQNDCYGFSRLGTDPDDANQDADSGYEIETPEDIPTIQALQNVLTTVPAGTPGTSVLIFTDLTPIAFAPTDFGAFDYWLLRKRRMPNGKTGSSVLEYGNPCGSEWDGDPEKEHPYSDSGRCERSARVIAKSLTEFLMQFDQPV